MAPSKTSRRGVISKVILSSGKSGFREVQEIRVPGSPGGHCCAAVASFNTNWYQFEPENRLRCAAVEMMKWGVE